MCNVKMTYTEVGGMINYEGVKLKVVPSTYNKAECFGCYFSDNERDKRNLPRLSCCAHGNMCTKHLRKDGRHVVFVEV